MGPMASWGPSERDAGRSESEGKAREAGVGGMPMRGAKATGVGGGAGGRGGGGAATSRGWDRHGLLQPWGLQKVSPAYTLTADY